MTEDIEEASSVLLDAVWHLLDSGATPSEVRAIVINAIDNWEPESDDS